jgi:hypothetical protein
VAVGEVRTERAQSLGAWPDVVVDDVEHDAETGVVRRVDEPRERLGPAVRDVRGKRVQPVVAPAAVARERRNGHHLDGRDAELLQLAQMLDSRVERPLGAERPNVQLIEHELVEPHSLPRRRAPAEVPGVEHPRRSLHALRLPA